MPITAGMRRDEHAHPQHHRRGGVIQAGQAMVVSPARRAAFDRFMASGLPHRRMEDWRWTDLKQLLARLCRRAGIDRSPNG